MNIIFRNLTALVQAGFPKSPWLRNLTVVFFTTTTTIAIRHTLKDAIKNMMN